MDDKSKNWIKYSQMGIQMLLTIGLGTYLGRYLDQKYPQKLPIFTLLFALMAIGAALYNAIKQLPKE